MFGGPVSSGLTFTKVLGGISKTLSIANQVIPLYREAKPMINNAKTILSVVKGLNSNNNNTTSKNVVKNEVKSDNQKKDTVFVRETRTNNPVFFL